MQSSNAQIGIEIGIDPKPKFIAKIASLDTDSIKIRIAARNPVGYCSSRVQRSNRQGMPRNRFRVIAA